MASTQDSSIGISIESTYKTYVAPTRWYEFTDESINWDKNVKQGVGLAVAQGRITGVRPDAQHHGALHRLRVGQPVGLAHPAVGQLDVGPVVLDDAGDGDAAKAAERLAAGSISASTGCRSSIAPT